MAQRCVSLCFVVTFLSDRSTADSVATLLRPLSTSNVSPSNLPLDIPRRPPHLRQPQLRAPLQATSRSLQGMQKLDPARSRNARPPLISCSRWVEILGWERSTFSPQSLPSFCVSPFRMKTNCVAYVPGYCSEKDRPTDMVQRTDPPLFNLLAQHHGRR